MYQEKIEALGAKTDKIQQWIDNNPGRIEVDKAMAEIECIVEEIRLLSLGDQPEDVCRVLAQFPGSQITEKPKPKAPETEQGRLI